MRFKYKGHFFRKRACLFNETDWDCFGFYWDAHYSVYGISTYRLDETGSRLRIAWRNWKKKNQMLRDLVKQMQERLEKLEKADDKKDSKDGGKKKKKEDEKKDSSDTDDKKADVGKK